MKIGIRYIAGIVVLILLGVWAYWSQQNISPQLGIFFSFILGYAIAVFVLFWVLGRYGG
jgi:hypothetical protein